MNHKFSFASVTSLVRELEHVDSHRFLSLRLGFVILKELLRLFEAQRNSQIHKLINSQFQKLDFQTNTNFGTIERNNQRRYHVNFVVCYREGKLGHPILKSKE